MQKLLPPERSGATRSAAEHTSRLREEKIGKWANSKDAKDHAVFARPWISNSLRILIDVAEITSISGALEIRRVANDHAVLDRFCGRNSRILILASVDIDSIIGRS